MKKFSVILIILTFFAFVTFEIQRKSSSLVLKIISPTEFVVDSNDNQVADSDEEVCIEGLEAFSLNKNIPNETLKKLKITEEESLALGYLGDNFASETLVNNEVQLILDKSKQSKNTSCKIAKISINNHDYETLLEKSGFSFRNGKICNQKAFEKNLIKAKALKLRIYNNKSHKYHKIDCKYGKLAHNFIILPEKQIPKNAIPCKFCLSNHPNYGTHKGYSATAASILKTQTILTQGCIKIFLTDLTTTQKPYSDCNTSICKEILNQINNTQNTLDMAIYGYSNIPKIHTALVNAQSRGVKIRVVYDINAQGENIYPDTLKLIHALQNSATDRASGELKNKSAYQNAIMHNKFFIFDDKRVITGSANLSSTDMSGFNSNVSILINSKAAANQYTQEFEQMYSGKFHTLKAFSANPKMDFGATKLSIYFSPQDKIITSKIIPLINQSKSYIYMPIFLITHKGLTNSLIDAKRRGVKVMVIVDATNAHGHYSKHKILRANGIEVKTENFAGKMHSKSIIIDDRYTILGSMNFSKSGESINDENVIIIENREIAIVYKNFFKYVWAKIPNKWLKLNARSESFDSIGSCSDGIDNNFDGKIDKADEGCILKK